MGKKRATKEEKQIKDTAKDARSHAIFRHQQRPLWCLYVGRHRTRANALRNVMTWEVWRGFEAVWKGFPPVFRVNLPWPAGILTGSGVILKGLGGI